MYQWAKEECFIMESEDIDFLISRGIMKTLCSTPVKRRNCWSLLVFCIGGQIHIATLPQSGSEQHQQMSPEAASGKVFEDMLRTGGRRTTGYLCNSIQFNSMSDVRSVRVVRLGSLKILSSCKVSCQLSVPRGDKPRKGLRTTLNRNV